MTRVSDAVGSKVRLKRGLTRAKGRLHIDPAVRVDDPHGLLTRRLRKLEELGLIARDPFVRSRISPYRLAPAGEQLVPTLLSLDAWARHWIPEDPALAQRDPDVITFWLANRVEPRCLPERPVVLVFDLTGAFAEKHWLIQEAAAPPSICLEDPDLAANRYVYVEADAATIYPISRGLREWSTATAERTVELFGEPSLVKALPTWFKSGGLKTRGLRRYRWHRSI